MSSTNIYVNKYVLLQVKYPFNGLVRKNSSLINPSPQLSITRERKSFMTPFPLRPHELPTSLQRYKSAYSQGIR